MTTAHSTTSPTPEELQVWTVQVHDFLETNNRKRITSEMREDLLAQGAKYCYTCQTTKAVTEYSKNSGRSDGLNSKCRTCSNGAGAEWRAEHLEEMRAYERDRWRNDEMRRMSDQLRHGYRRAAEAGNEAERITAEDLLTYWSEKGIDPLRCIYTGEKLTPQNRSLDHCTPISRGGSHTVDNIMPCSWQANDNKRSRTALEYMADRAAEQSNEDLPELVKRAMSTTAPVRKTRTVQVQIEEKEGDRA